MPITRTRKSARTTCLAILIATIAAATASARQQDPGQNANTAIGGTTGSPGSLPPKSGAGRDDKASPDDKHQSVTDLETDAPEFSVVTNSALGRGEDPNLAATHQYRFGPWSPMAFVFSDLAQGNDQDDALLWNRLKQKRFPNTTGTALLHTTYKTAAGSLTMLIGLTPACDQMLGTGRTSPYKCPVHILTAGWKGQADPAPDADPRWTTAKGCYVYNGETDMQSADNGTYNAVYSRFDPVDLVLEVRTMVHARLKTQCNLTFHVNPSDDRTTASDRQAQDGYDTTAND